MNQLSYHVDKKKLSKRGLFLNSNLDRDIEELIQSGGFKFKDLKKKYIKGPKIASFQYYGEALKV